MNKYFLGFYIFFLITPALFAQEKGVIDTTRLAQKLREQTETWKQAYNSKDAQNLITLYTVDAVYISSHVAGLVLEGRDKLIANFQNGITNGGHIDSIEILSMNISTDLATLFCRYKATNSGVTVVGRNLLVLKKINNKWLIVTHMTVV